MSYLLGKLYSFPMLPTPHKPGVRKAPWTSIVAHMLDPTHLQGMSRSPLTALWTHWSHPHPMLPAKLKTHLTSFVSSKPAQVSCWNSRSFVRKWGVPLCRKGNVFASLRHTVLSLLCFAFRFPFLPSSLFPSSLPSSLLPSSLSLPPPFLPSFHIKSYPCWMYTTWWIGR